MRKSKVASGKFCSKIAAAEGEGRFAKIASSKEVKNEELFAFLKNKELAPQNKRGQNEIKYARVVEWQTRLFKGQVGNRVGSSPTFRTKQNKSEPVMVRIFLFGIFHF